MITGETEIRDVNVEPQLVEWSQSCESKQDLLREQIEVWRKIEF